MTTADPTVDPRAEGSVSYARFNTQKYQAYATGGIGIVAMDIEGTYTQSNNFLRNIIPDVNKNNYAAAYQDWTVRTGLKFQFSDAVSVLLRYSHTRQNDPTPVQTNSNTDTTIDPTTGKPWGTQTICRQPASVPWTVLDPSNQVYTTNPNLVAADLPTYDIPVTDIETMTVKADLGFANFTSLSQYRQEITAAVDRSRPDRLPRSFSLDFRSTTIRPARNSY